MARSGRYRSRTWCACGPGSVAPTRSEQRAAADFAAVLEREGRSNAGPALRVALVEAVDAWLAELLGDVRSELSLVATGGYGRRGPAPRSDVDLMMLDDRGSEEIAPLAERLWRPIWVAGMRLDHSVRTVDEALAVAATDLKTALGLLDARHVAGDGALVASLRERALERWRATARERLEQLRAACQRRAERHGELAFLLEPDLKEARGGLRDGLAVRAISATWVAAGLDRRGQAAYGLLLDTRPALHLELLEQGGGQVGRARAVVDRLGLQEQEAVAARLGEPGAEALMRAVHEAGRTLARALDQSWRRVDARHAGPAVRRWRRPVRRQLGGGVVAYDGEVLLAAGADLAEKPWLALEVAAAAAGAGMPLAPQTLRRLEARPPRLPEPWPPRAREALVALLGAGRPGAQPSAAGGHRHPARPGRPRHGAGGRRRGRRHRHARVAARPHRGRRASDRPHRLDAVEGAPGRGAGRARDRADRGPPARGRGPGGSGGGRQRGHRGAGGPRGPRAAGRGRGGHGGRARAARAAVAGGGRAGPAPAGRARRHGVGRRRHGGDPAQRGPPARARPGLAPGHRRPAPRLPGPATAGAAAGRARGCLPAARSAAAPAAGAVRRPRLPPGDRDRGALRRRPRRALPDHQGAGLERRAGALGPHRHLRRRGGRRLLRARPRRPSPGRPAPAGHPGHRRHRHPALTRRARRPAQMAITTALGSVQNSRL